MSDLIQTRLQHYLHWRYFAYASVLALLFFAHRAETWALALERTGVVLEGKDLATEFGDGLYWHGDIALVRSEHVRLEGVEFKARLKNPLRWEQGKFSAVLRAQRLCLVIPPLQLEFPPHDILVSLVEVFADLYRNSTHIDRLEAEAEQVIVSRDDCKEPEALRLSAVFKVGARTAQTEPVLVSLQIAGDLNASLAASLSPNTSRAAWFGLSGNLDVAQMTRLITAGALVLPPQINYQFMLAGREGSHNSGLATHFNAHLSSPDSDWQLLQSPSGNIAYDSTSGDWAIARSPVTGAIAGKDFGFGPLAVHIGAGSLRNTRFVAAKSSHLQDYSHLIVSQSWLPQSLHTWTKNLGLRGTVGAIAGTWDGGTGLRLTTEVLEACIQAYKVVPHICPASGRILLDWPYLQADVSAEDVLLDITTAFDSRWMLSSGQLKILADFGQPDRRINLWLKGIEATSNAGAMDADIRFQILPQHATSFVDVWLESDSVDIAEMSPFLPTLPAVRGVTNVLRQSLRSGRISRLELALSAATGPGATALIGTGHKPGVALLIQADDVEFVMPEWISLQHASANLWTTAAQTLLHVPSGVAGAHYEGSCRDGGENCEGLQARGVKVLVKLPRSTQFPAHLAEDYNSVLTVSGRMSGEFARLMRTLGSMKALAGSEGFFLDGEFAGTADGTLHIEFGIPGPDLPPPEAAFRDIFAMQALADLSAGAIVLPDIPVSITNIAGSFGFDIARGFWSEHLTARFFGGDLTAGIASNATLRKDQVVSRIRVNGNLDPTHLSPWLGSVAGELMSGLSPYQGTMDFPLLGGDAPIVFDVSSDLAGIAFALPQPLAKSTEETVRTRLHLYLETWEAPLDLDISLPQLKAALRIEETDMHGRVSVGAESFAWLDHSESAPLGGIELHAHVERADLLQWLDISERLAAIPSDYQKITDRSPVRYLKAKANTGVLMGVEVPDVEVVMLADDSRSQLGIEAVAPAGQPEENRLLQVTGALPAADELPLTGEVRLKSLDIDQVEFGERSDEFARISGTWKIDDLRYGDHFALGSNSGTVVSQRHTAQFELEPAPGQLLPASGALVFTLAQDRDQLDKLSIDLKISEWEQDFASLFGFADPMPVHITSMAVAGEVGTRIEDSIGDIAKWSGKLRLRADEIDYPQDAYKNFDVPQWLQGGMGFLNAVNLGGVLLQGKSPSPTYLEHLEGEFDFHSGVVEVEGFEYAMPAAKGEINAWVRFDPEVLSQSQVYAGLSAEIPVFKSVPWALAILGATASVFWGTWLTEKVFSRQLSEWSTISYCLRGPADDLSAFGISHQQLADDPACEAVAEPEDSKDEDKEALLP